LGDLPTELKADRGVSLTAELFHRSSTTQK
jgi:hypothetical protein